MVSRGFNHTKTPMPRCAPRVMTASLLAFVSLSAGPTVSSARAQEADRSIGLFDRILAAARLVQRARTVCGPGSARCPTPSVALDRLETQIRQLTGVIEQLQFRNQQLEGQLRRLQEDTDYRFQESGGKGAARPALQSRPQNPPPQPSSPATTGAPGRRGDAFDPTQNPNAPGAPHTLGSVNAAGASSPMSSPMSPPVAADEPVGAPGGRGAGAPLDLANMGPPGGAPGQSLRILPAVPWSPRCRPATPRQYDLAYG